MTSASQTPPPAPTRSRRASRLAWPAFAIALVVILVDQLSKWWAVAQLGDGQVIPVIGDVIRFVLVYNPGAAFSIGSDFTWVFAVAAAAAVVWITTLAWRVESRGWMVALGLLLGGAVTHLGDRLFREPGFARGHVVDFIGYGNLFIGNVADIAIFAGAIMLAILTVMGVHMRRPAAEPADDASSAPEDPGTRA
ncbi:signal peptidase II [Cryobacterium sp. SO2]|uniref:signal peptidase II n=1 Tax=Cryobacterium sp. SO2 TaxID=1897060 RepID=UPI00223CB556|nr:signal peptidase II [Cryobacterium sp. SO2]WEO77110.1 signal peptidase II [Cryobacterium sp. SO2]